MTVLRVVYILFFREERKGLASISSADGKISWYLPFSTSCKLALARDVAVKSIKEALSRTMLLSGQTKSHTQFSMIIFVLHGSTSER